MAATGSRAPQKQRAPTFATLLLLLCLLSAFSVASTAAASAESAEESGLASSASASASASASSSAPAAAAGSYRRMCRRPPPAEAARRINEALKDPCYLAYADDCRACSENVKGINKDEGKLGCGYCGGHCDAPRGCFSSQKAAQCYHAEDEWRDPPMKLEQCEDPCAYLDEECDKCVRVHEHLGRSKCGWCPDDNNLPGKEGTRCRLILGFNDTKDQAGQNPWETLQRCVAPGGVRVNEGQNAGGVCADEYINCADPSVDSCESCAGRWSSPTRYCYWCKNMTGCFASDEQGKADQCGPNDTPQYHVKHCSRRDGSNSGSGTVSAVDKPSIDSVGSSTGSGFTAVFIIIIILSLAGIGYFGYRHFLAASAPGTTSAGRGGGIFSCCGQGLYSLLGQQPDDSASAARGGTATASSSTIHD